jgi:hypothetical protein
MAGESAHEMARRAREKAARLERQADHWERGSLGERAAGEVLTSLPEGWSALHDVRWPGRPRANIDHVVIGPGGVFVIDTKNWTGRITVSNGVLRQNGRSREQTVASAAEAGLAVASLAGPHLAHVHPVLCFVDQPQLGGWSRDVMVCSTGNLLDMLQTRPVVLTPDAVGDAWHRLAPRLTSASAPAAPVRRRTEAAPRRSHTSRSRSRSKQRGPSLARLVVGAFLVLGMLTKGPEFADLVAKVIVTEAATPSSRPSSTPEKAAPKPHRHAKQAKKASDAE